MKDEHAIAALCRHLAVSPSGYYAWQQRRVHPGPRAVADQLLGRRITTIFAGSRQTYGSPRIQQELGKQGHRHGRNRTLPGSCGRGDFAAARKPATGCGPPTLTMLIPSRPTGWRTKPKATGPNQI